MPKLNLSLLGAPALWLDAQAAPAFVYNKSRALLFYLAVEADRPHSRDSLTALLWPDLPDKAARSNLRQALADLRRVLHDETAPQPFVLVTGDTLLFNQACEHELDITRFTQLVAEASAHTHRHLSRCAQCAMRLEQAVAVYQGELLHGFHLNDATPFEEWLLLKREVLHHQAQTAFSALTDFYTRRREFEKAVLFARRWLELDPWREEVHQRLMQLYVASGQRSVAMRQYELCRRILSQEMEIEPSRETTRLYESIRAEQNAPPGESNRNALPFTMLLGAATINYELPAPSPLIGRERELAELGELLADPAHRLITIFGPGGIGKSHLALAVAAQQAEAFREGAVMVPLVAITDPEFLPQAVLSALNLPIQSSQSPHDQVRRYLRDKEMLLLLDNYEQLLPAVDLLTDLLRYSPALTLLVTSRERIGLSSEWLYTLAGLHYPVGREGGTKEKVEEYAAVQLFLQCLQQSQSGATLASADVQAIGRIAQLVEGMPLALELAASTARELSLPAIVAAFEQGQQLQPPRIRGLPERHLSIWRAFEHSWHLLSPVEQEVFVRLALFRGGFGEEAAQQVAAASPSILAALVDKSLLQRPAPAWYALHEQLRHFAATKMQEVQLPEAALQNAHLRYYLAFAERAESHLRGPQQREWMEQLERNHDNLRAALAYALAADPSAMLSLVVALAPFWRTHGDIREGFHWLQVALTHSDPSNSTYASTYAKTLMWTGSLARFHLEREKALLWVHQALDLLRAQGDNDGVVQALRQLGWIYARIDVERAANLQQESLALVRKLGNKQRIAEVLTDLAYLASIHQEDMVTAKRYLQESLPLHQEVGDLRGIGLASQALANIAILEGDYAQAGDYIQEAIVIYEALNARGFLAGAYALFSESARHRGALHLALANAQRAYLLYQEIGEQKSDHADILNDLGLCELLLGNPAQAQLYLHDCLRMSQSQQRAYAQAICLAGLGGLAAHQGQAARAIHRLSVAFAHFVKDRPVLAPGDWKVYEGFIELSRSLVDEESFATLWAQGQATPLEEAVASALKDDNPVSP